MSWRTDRPPLDKWVQVEVDSMLTVAKAIAATSQDTAHWLLADGTRYEPHQIFKWKAVTSPESVGDLLVETLKAFRQALAPVESWYDIDGEEYGWPLPLPWVVENVATQLSQERADNLEAVAILQKIVSQLASPGPPLVAREAMLDALTLALDKLKGVPSA